MPHEHEVIELNEENPPPHSSDRGKSLFNRRAKTSLDVFLADDGDSLSSSPRNWPGRSMYTRRLMSFGDSVGDEKEEFEVEVEDDDDDGIIGSIPCGFDSPSVGGIGAVFSRSSSAAGSAGPNNNIADDIPSMVAEHTSSKTAVPILITSHQPAAAASSDDSGTVNSSRAFSVLRSWEADRQLRQQQYEAILVPLVKDIISTLAAGIEADAQFIRYLKHRARFCRDTAARLALSNNTTKGGQGTPGVWAVLNAAASSSSSRSKR